MGQLGVPAGVGGWDKATRRCYEGRSVGSTGVWAEQKEGSSRCSVAETGMRLGIGLEGRSEWWPSASSPWPAGLVGSQGMPASVGVWYTGRRKVVGEDLDDLLGLGS